MITEKVRGGLDVKYQCLIYRQSRTNRLLKAHSLPWSTVAEVKTSINQTKFSLTKIKD